MKKKPDGRRSDMESKNDYYNKLLNTIDYYGLKVNHVKNKEFIMLSTLERECHRSGSNIDKFFYLMEDKEYKITPEEALDNLPLPLIMKAVDSIRKEKNISKRSLSKSIEMDRANYQKYYKSKGSINFSSFTRILEALDVDLISFLERCREINNGNRMEIKEG